MAAPPIKIHELEPRLDPWERQPQETERSFRVFIAYRDQGDERSIRKAAKASDIYETQAQRWAIGWRWKQRALAFDQSLDEERIKVQRKEIRDMAKRHAALANAGLGVLQKPIAELIDRISTGKFNIAGLSDMELIKVVRQSAQAIEALVRVERVARGAPATTDVHAVVATTAGQPGTIADAVDKVFSALREQAALEAVAAEPGATTEEPPS